MTATVPQLQTKTPSEVVYPSGDGEPVAETYAHLYAMFVTIEVLRQYLIGQQATVLGNQFLYYAEGFPRLRVAPDVMVIFGVEPGGRDNFKTWEEGAVPSVIFEMTSAGTRQKDESSKYELYESLGVTEYWQFDPKGEWIENNLKGYCLVGEAYEVITDSVSQVLQLRLAHEDGLIVFHQLETGKRLLSPDELRVQVEESAKRENRLTEKLRSLGIDPDEV